MLEIEINISAPDDFYEALMALHRDLTPEQSRRVNAKLILLMANHIGDPAILREAMERARAGIVPAGRDGTLAAKA
ncbi:MAG: DUF2783 domain-containing protein [Hyphomonadaceae bacterium]